MFCSSFVVYYTQNDCATLRQMYSPCWGKKTPHPSILVIWPLHTHRSHLFEPLQSVLVKEGFLFLKCHHFTIDCTCLIMRKNSIYGSIEGCVVFLPTHFVSPSIQPSLGFWLLWQCQMLLSSDCLLNSWVLQQKGHHRDGWEATDT